MTQPVPTSVRGAGSAPASWREGMLAFPLIVGFILLLTTVSGGGFLIGRPLWLDEIFTWLFASDPSLPHAMDALLHGCDTNPPLLTLTLRGLHLLGMPLSEFGLRSCALAFMGLGLLGVYLALRRVTDRLRAAVVLAVLMAGFQFGSNLYQARFYGPWFAIAAWFCFALATAPASRFGRALRHSAVAALSPLLVTIHYFGVISFGLIVLSDLLLDRRSWRERIVCRWPLLGCVPGLAVVAVFYRHHSRVFTITWIDPVTFTSAARFLQISLYFWPLVAIASLTGAAWLCRRRRAVWRAQGATLLQPLAGMLGLLGMPWAVLAISLLMQPADLPRYAIPGMCGVAACAAIGLNRLPRLLVLAVGIGCLAAAYVQMHKVARDGRAHDESLAAIVRQADATPPGETIVFEVRYNMCSAVLYGPRFKDRAFILDFATDQVPAAQLRPSANFAIMERDASRVVQTYYPQFQMLPETQLPRGAPFLLVAVEPRPHEDITARLTARFHPQSIRQLEGSVFELTLPAR